jgi:Zn finger protein HypA/HybF involved in hydrogenase expression
MSAELTYTLNPKAELAIASEKVKVLGWRKLNLITSKQAQEMFNGFVAKTVYHAREDASEEKPICSQCPACLVEHIMPANVLVYRCPCTPHEDRHTWQHRVILGGK